MSSEIIINSTRGKSRIGLLKEKKLVEFHQETDEVKFNVGDIYFGRIKKINKRKISLLQKIKIISIKKVFLSQK